MRKVLDQCIAGSLDVFLYAGPIEKTGYDDLCNLLRDKIEAKKKGKKVLLFLLTGGGNPNAGYRIARALIHHYEADNFRVAVPAECKSAGTLICMGANSIVLFDQGELGPLDVQFQKQDELFQQSSGLDILRGMTYLRKEALETFNEYLLDINGGSGLSTKVASEIASKLVMGLFEPMFAQIDPIRLGEMNAALQIAHEYGNRLGEKAKNLKPGALSKLINNYPTHGFVIDRAEARTLFERVESPGTLEFELAAWAIRLARNWKALTRPHVFDVVDFFDDIFPPEETPNANGPGDQGGNPEQAAPPAGNEAGEPHQAAQADNEPE